LRKHKYLIIVALLLLVGVFAMTQVRASIRKKNEELAVLITQCEQQNAQNQALSELLENSDDEYIEDKAREELNMVYPGERVYIIRPGN